MFVHEPSRVFVLYGSKKQPQPLAIGCRRKYGGELCHLLRDCLIRSATWFAHELQKLVGGALHVVPARKLKWQKLRLQVTWRLFETRRQLVAVRIERREGVRALSGGKHRVAISALVQRNQCGVSADQRERVEP